MAHPTIHRSGLSMMSRYLNIDSLEIQGLESHLAGVQRWAAEKIQSETESTRVLASHCRRIQPIDIPRSGIREDHTASYFSHDNVEATRLRDKLASDSLEMLIQWLKDGGNVGILGATPGDPS